MSRQNTDLRMQAVLEKMRENGYRITHQRKIILEVILSGKYSCCKEICYQVEKRDPGIGSATVYRMIQTLEELGAISREEMYRIQPMHLSCHGGTCELKLNDGSKWKFPDEQWKHIIYAGLKACGYT